MMTERVYNFSAGPAVLPLAVLQQAQRELVALPGVGMSVLEISHRSETFAGILKTAKDRLRTLLGIPQNYHVLFLQGGSRLQFAMVPMNLLHRTDHPADYVVTGSWGNHACQEAQRQGKVRIAWNGKATGYDRIPSPEELRLDPSAAYVHFTSNETIEGIQFASQPDTGSVPLVCDASSDLLSRPLPVDRYGLIYACAQKIAGPAGVTILIIRDDLVQHSDDSLPGYLSYRVHAENDSLFNTPCTFGIYLVNLVAQWLLDDIGGLKKMHQLNQKKAKLIYDVIDESGGFYVGHARPECRSLMNVTFRLPTDQLQSAFVHEARERGLCDLAGHRSVGGIRASLYNAMPREGVETLGQFMREFLADKRK